MTITVRVRLHWSATVTKERVRELTNEGNIRTRDRRVKKFEENCIVVA